MEHVLRMCSKSKHNVGGGSCTLKSSALSSESFAAADDRNVSTLASRSCASCKACAKEQQPRSSAMASTPLQQ